MKANVKKELNRLWELKNSLHMEIRAGKFTGPERDEKVREIESLARVMSVICKVCN
jgi:hypothetical protein